MRCFSRYDSLHGSSWDQLWYQEFVFGQHGEATVACEPAVCKLLTLNLRLEYLQRSSRWGSLL